MLNKTGNVYWLTGLPGAGKTTLGKMLHDFLKYKKHRSTVLLDGDQIRVLLGLEQAYSLEERLHLAMTYGRLCHFFANQGIDVVCATVSLFHKVQNWNRKNIPHFYEILIQVPMDILANRDQKNLYSQAAIGRAHQVPGIDLEVEWPKNPDLIVFNDGNESPDIVLKTILKHLRLS